MKIRVLAIDDSRTIRTMVQKAITEAGLECVLADDGAQGVARFQQDPPDVVITDINMPHLDGYGVIAAIRGGDIHATGADSGADHGKLIASETAGKGSRCHGLDHQAF